jgi:excisionase family DNA binding protein
MELEEKYGPTPTVAQAAEILHQSDTVIYRRIYAGEMKVLRGRGTLRIPLSEIRKFLNRTEIYVPKKRHGSGRKKKVTLVAVEAK